MPFFSKTLVKCQENFEKSQENFSKKSGKFLSLTCGNPEYTPMYRDAHIFTHFLFNT